MQLVGRNYVVTGPVSGLGTADGWVKTRLQQGDELATLAPLYNISAQDIVAGNDVSFTTPDINAWVLATGGATLSDGQPVFTGNSVIYLPPGGPRSPAEGDVAVAGLSSGALAVGALGLLGIFGLIGLARHRKPKGRRNPRRKKRRSRRSRR